MWTYPSWYILLSFSVPSWTTHHHVKLADFFSISSASILSTYLCPFPKLDCRVNKFNYSMFSIYLNFFLLFQLFPQFAFKFCLRKIPTCKTYHVNLYSKPSNSFSCEDSFLCSKFCLLLTSSLGSSPLHVALPTLNSLLLLQKVKPLPASGLLHLRLPLAGIFIFQTATLPLSLGLSL